jgi:hypothetical protein
MVALALCREGTRYEENDKTSSGCPQREDKEGETINGVCMTLYQTKSYELFRN